MPTTTPIPASATSERGIAMIKREEGFRPRPYMDLAGYWTIGYGTKLEEDDRRAYPEGIDEVTGDRLLRVHLGNVVDPALRRLVTVPLAQHQWDALADFTYNLGDGALASSTLLRKLNKGDYYGASNEFARWDKAHVAGQVVEVAGLKMRRANELAMWDEADYADPEQAMAAGI